MTVRRKVWLRYVWTCSECGTDSLGVAYDRGGSGQFITEDHCRMAWECHVAVYHPELDR